MWHFTQSGALDSNTKPKLGDFFNAQKAATSVVRESIQNSLDARDVKRSDKVCVRFTISERSWKDIASFAQTEDGQLTLDHHTNSDDLGKYAKTFSGKKPIRCLAVEDYGTMGLTGTTDKNDARSGSNFVGFWWNEGITGKAKGTLGGHGVGKITLTRASEMSTFWALTKRADDEKTFLIGFANLPFHHLSNRNYRGDGRFGVYNEEGGKEIFLPVVDPNTISKFSEVAGLDRSDFGLSVFIPAVVKGINHDAMLQAVIEDYYWPILDGKLEVTICDLSLGIETTVDVSNLAEAMDRLGNTEKSDKIRKLVNVAAEVRGMKSGNPNYFAGVQPEIQADGKPRLTASQFTPENLARIKDQFEKGRTVAVQCSVELEPKDGQSVTGTLEVFLKGTSEANSDRIGQYIRQGLVITQQQNNISGKFEFCFVVVDDKDMSDYLGSSEGVAHTNWGLGQFNEIGNYKSDGPLRFVMDAANQFYQIAAGEDEEKNAIQNFADDIFSIDRPGAGKEQEPKPHSKKRKRLELPVTPRPETKPVELIRLEKLDDGTGYSIYPANDLTDVLMSEGISLPFRIDIKSAYLSVKGNSKSFKDYSQLDFDYASTIKLEVSSSEAVKVLEQSVNKLSLEIFSPTFQIQVKGFDKHRDLLNRTTLKVSEIEVAS